MSDKPEYIGRFPIVKTLGVGGMGVVYLARDPDIGRKVAIKVLHSTGDKEALERFKNEARTMGEISHPNIVILLEYGIDNNRPFLVMEYLSGLSLEKWIKKSHTLNEHKKIILQLCSALKFAHDKEILHRDLKPENVQILPSGDAKLLDFGIATGETTGLTATGYFIGTPKYLAPEILQDTTHSKTSDCYSLGLLAYSMLSGKNPFAAENFEATMTRLLTKTPISLHKLNPKIPQELSKTIDVYLEKNPQNRPNTPEKLKLTLELLTKRNVLDQTISSNQNTGDIQAQETTILMGQFPKPKKKILILMATLIFGLSGVLIYQRYIEQDIQSIVPVDETPIEIATQVTNITPNDIVDEKETTTQTATDTQTQPPELTQDQPEENKSKEKNKDITTTPATIVEIPVKQPIPTVTLKSKDKPKIQPRKKPTTTTKPVTKSNVVQTTINKPETKPTAKNLDSNTIITYKEPKKKVSEPTIISLPTFNNNHKKVILATNSSTQISRGRTKSIIINTPDDIIIDGFELSRGSSEFKYVKIKKTAQLNKNQIKVNLYAQSNAPIGEFSLIGLYQNKKTKPLRLEVTL